MKDNINFDMNAALKALRDSLLKLLYPGILKVSEHWSHLVQN